MLRLRLVRVQRGLTIRDVAKALGFNRSNLGFLELGRLNPTPAEAAKLAEFFGLPATDLFDEVSDSLVPSAAVKAAALVASESTEGADQTEER